MKLLDVTRYIAIALWTMSIAIGVKKLRKSKKEDPESSTKQNLTIIQMTLEVMFIALLMKRVSIYFWI